MSTKDLTAKVRSLKELEALITEAQAEAESIKDELKAEMINRNTEEMMVDVFKIRYKTVKSNRFDTTAFKSTHKELYNQYIKQTESRRFTVA
jgi:predicted phage-related endonuclease